MLRSHSFLMRNLLLQLMNFSGVRRVRILRIFLNPAAIPVAFAADKPPGAHP
jgi:hypothetical protein